MLVIAIVSPLAIEEFDVDSVLSSETAGRLDGDGGALRPQGEAMVRGKAAAVRIFTLK